ncbi:MAG: hypothetical protein B7X76_09755 [Azorhizobium sp. 39-67-5]|nr:MAG: hypothetical protein B7X76_09755 [Azorhizobium sp. 39-67-5]
MRESADLKNLITNPQLGREEAGRAMDAVGALIDLGDLTKKFIGVLAANRRLSALPDVIRAFAQIAAASRGEATAEVTSAHALDDAQIAADAGSQRTEKGRSDDGG